MNIIIIITIIIMVTVMIAMTHIEAARLGELVIVGGGVEAGSVLVALVSLNMKDEGRTYQFSERR